MKTDDIKCSTGALHILIRVNNAPGEMPPRGAVSKGVNRPPSARGSVRYGATFHGFSYSSSNIFMATAMLC